MHAQVLLDEIILAKAARIRDGALREFAPRGEYRDIGRDAHAVLDAREVLNGALKPLLVRFGAAQRARPIDDAGTQRLAMGQTDDRAEAFLPARIGPVDIDEERRQRAADGGSERCHPIFVVALPARMARYRRKGLGIDDARLGKSLQVKAEDFE